MPPYSYDKLNTNAQEIRLLTLIPGHFDDPIQFIISHEQFYIPNHEYRPRKITKEHRDSLPNGWRIGVTLEGRIIFICEADGDMPQYTSWTHPEPSLQVNVDDFLLSPRSGRGNSKTFHIPGDPVRYQ